ncbi:Rab GTPase-binding exocyst subunit [Martiniozyma asiatica (nom. inval.)]|nr:Rab GTPase-binding exocyst subunit [Martiniozyma asiatica]
MTVDTDFFTYALSTEDCVDQLLPLVRQHITDSGSLHDLIDSLEEQATHKDEDLNNASIEAVKDLTGSINTIKAVANTSDKLSTTIVKISKELNVTGSKVVDQQKKVNHFKQLEAKIGETQDLVSVCLDILGKTNKVFSLVQKSEFYRALVQLSTLNDNYYPDLDFDFVNKIYESVPIFKKMLTDESLEQLNSWLNVSVGKVLTDMGESMYENMEMISEDWKVKQVDNYELIYFKVNSTVERTYRDGSLDCFDPLEKLDIDLTPLYHAYLLFSDIGDLETLSDNLSNGLLKLRETILSPFKDNSISNTNSLKINMYSLCAYCIFEKLIAEKTDYALSSKESIDTTIKGILNKLAPVLAQYMKRVNNEIGRVSKFEKINETLGTFYQILTNCGFDGFLIYSVMLDGLNGYLMSIYDEFEENYNQIVNSESWQGYQINSIKEFEDIKLQSFYMFTVENPKFPMKAPFSALYLLTCKSLRMFINKAYKYVEKFYSDNLNQVIKVINISIDRCLRNVILRDLTHQINSAYESVKSQNLINLEFFCSSIYEIEKWINFSSDLTVSRTRSATRNITLSVKHEFESAKHTAEVNLLQNVNDMMQNLIDPNDLDWIKSYWSSDILLQADADSTDNINIALGFLYDTFSLKFSSLPGHTKASLLLEAIDKISQLLAQGIFTATLITEIAVLNFTKDVHFIESTIDKFYIHEGSSIIGENDIHKEVLKNALIYLRQIIRLLSEMDVSVIKDGGTKMRLKEKDAIILLQKYEGYQKQKEIERQNVLNNSSIEQSEYTEEYQDDNQSLFKGATSVFQFKK